VPTGAAETNWGAVAYVLVATVLGSFAALWAQGAPVNRGMRSALYATIGFVGGLFLIIGLVALRIPFVNPWGSIVASLAILLPLWRPFRQLVARVAPIDPASATHMVAIIAVIVMLLVAVASMLGAVQNQEPVPQSTNLVEAVAQHLSLVVLSFFAVGLWLRRTWRATLQRLGLTLPTLMQTLVSLLLALAVALINVVLSRVVWPYAPTMVSTDHTDRIAELLYAQLPDPLAATVVALSAAIGMEILFRGALQPRLGLPITAVTYTVVQAQYPVTPSLLTVFVLALALGMVRQHANTTACIVTHAAYNLLLVTVALASGTGQA